MALRRQTQVLAELDHAAGKRVRAIRGRYREKTIGPIVRRIEKAKNLAGLLRQLGPGLLREMDSSDLAGELADMRVQAGLIGRVSARPKGSPPQPPPKKGGGTPQPPPAPQEGGGGDDAS